MGFSVSGGSVGTVGPIQPFTFATYSALPTLAKATTWLLSAAQAERSLAVPVGAGRALEAGKVLQFVAGGIMSTGDIQGTLMISPFYGATSKATPLGPSPEQAYVPGLVDVPWRIVGELVFRSVSLVSTSSVVWCSGEFTSAGHPNVEGSGLTLPFGSRAAVTIDSKGPIGNTAGALNISATFAAALVSASISAQYAFVRSI